MKAVFNKIWLELLLIGLFVACIFFAYKNDNHVNKSVQDRLDSLQNEVIKQHVKLDSISEIERTQVNKTTIIKNYYDSTKTVIINLPDSVQHNLLFSNVNRFAYLLD